MSDLTKWYSEIINTQPTLEIDGDLTPTGFSLGPMIPRDAMEAEAEKYKSMAINLMEENQRDASGFLNKDDRPFFHLNNRCGPMKSAYAETLLNHILLLNIIKNPKQDRKPVLPIDYLDNYMHSNDMQSHTLQLSLNDKDYHSELLKTLK